MKQTEQKTESGGMGGGRLLRVAASCPQCGQRPALRVTADAVEAALAQPPDARMGTYQCQRRGCGTIYDLTARAYQKST